MPVVDFPEAVTALGFVVIGRNEGPRLSACISSLRAAGAPIVYADSASSDGSAMSAREAGAIVVEVAADAPLNAARGRNSGLSALRSRYPELAYVQFIDGDCLLEKDWIAAALGVLEARPDVAVTCGRRREQYPEASFYNRLFDAEWDTQVGPALACGGDSMMRLAALDQVGAFDATLMAGEEAELCARLRSAKWEILRLDVPMTVHDAATHSLGQWLRRALRSGYGYAQANAATRHLHPPLYRRQLASAALWAGLVPLGAVALALITGEALLLLLVPLATAVQVARIARRQGAVRGASWRKAAVTMIAKYYELAGALRYRLSAGPSGPIEYKHGSTPRGTGLLDGRLSFGLPEAILLTVAGIAAAVWVAIRSA